ncbi:MAG: transglycosylase domain-containing protein [Spirochaetales bacterium]|nr:transglycosylase domain-containing protein [Spirochaetales bacterium]
MNSTILFFIGELQRRIPKKITALQARRIIFWIVVSLIALILLQAFLKADLVSPPATPIFEDRSGAFLSEGASEYQSLGFWDIQGEIPPRIKASVLIIEDKRFYSHMGIDYWALGRAFVSNLFSQDRQGASTIPMQVARLQNPGDRNIINKANEMLIGFFLLLRHGHENVLRHYMKIAPQGHQAHGFAYGARRFFRKPLVDVNWAEAALLASLPKSPSTMNVFNYWGFQRAQARARVILRLLFTAHKISREEYQIALRQLGEMHFQLREQRPDNAYHYIFRAIQEYREKPKTEITRPVRTTLDSDLQEYLSSLAANSIMSLRQLGAGNVSMIVAKRDTGEVVGYVGSAQYFDESFAGAINYAATPRSSGSTVKPFLYALGLESGVYNPGSIIPDLPFSIIGPNGEYSLGNFDEEYLGPMLYRRALANSRNIPTVRVLEQIGLDRSYDYFREMGLVTDDKPAGYYGYGLPVGGLYVTLEDLVSAYGILANDGREFHLSWFPDEKKNDTLPRRRMSEYAAREVTLFLSDTLARLPSFKRLEALEFQFPVAIKTGTSQGFRDAWAIAYSDSWIVGAWMGHPENRAMNHISGSVVAYLVQDIMNTIHPKERRGVDIVPFKIPEGTVPVRVCIFSGKRAGPDCSAVSIEYFPEGTEPYDLCPVHRRFAVDARTGELADEHTLPRQIESRLFTVLPPEYASWGATHGFAKPVVDTSEEPLAEVKLVFPMEGTRLLLDPETPRQFQSISLRCEVMPYVPEVIWYVDGQAYAKVGYPYEARWTLQEGEHAFQVRFPKANVRSNVITVRVGSY